MVSDARLAEVLTEFARTLVTDFPIQGILDHLVQRIVDILPIDAAGVSLISATTDPRLIAGSDESATRYENLQTALGEGPCLAAYETGTAISLPDLRHNDRFPRFTEHALSEGLAAVFTFPLRTGERRLGALDLYRTTPGDLDGADMAAAQTLADVTTAYLVNAQDRVAKVEFVAALSHELRTPMTSISGFIELLSEDPDGRLSEDQNTFLSAIRHNGERLMSLADDLLTISSLEAAAQRHMLHAVDLGKVVVQAHAAISSVIAHRGLVVTFEVPEEPVNIQGDIPNLESMVSNLVSNALKFTEDGGWVRCTLRVVDGAARLQVSDSGLGIPLAEQPDLFTRFYRSSTARAHAIQGSGLGLTIVASVVHQHGGEISFISEDEVGSTFTVNLPLAHPHSLTPLAPEPV